MKTFEKHIFEYKGVKLHFDKSGRGSRIMLGFHGFGQSHHHYNRFAKVLGDEYTFYSFDLFYHGHSFWPDSEKALTKEFWIGLMEEFLHEYRINQFSLVGFSLGGKFVLATLEAFPSKVKEVIFIAPDGVKTSFWFSLATYPGWAQRYFKHLVHKPDSFFKLLNILRKLNVVDKGLLKFAEWQMGQKNKREQVYNSWMVLRALNFDMVKIAKLINHHKIKVHMFLGKYDRIITAKNMTTLLNHLKDYNLEILDSGHNFLIEEVADFYQKNHR